MNEPMKYPFSIRILHWTIAVIILGLLPLGVLMTPYDLDNVEWSETLYFWHKSFGLLVLLLMCVRLAIRTRSRTPEPPPGLSSFERNAATVGHKLLYVLAFAVPILGYIQSSTYEASSGVHFFFVDLPELLPDSERGFEVTNLIHRVLAYSLLALIAIHVAGALKHRFFDKADNDVLNRML